RPPPHSGRARGAPPRGARMGDDPRRALGAGRLAVRARPRGAARHPAGGGGRPPVVRAWRAPCAGRGCGLIAYVCRIFCAELVPTSAENAPVRKSVAEVLGGIDRGRALADLEVQLRRVDVAGLAGKRDGLAALDLIAALDLDLARMGVGGDETA